MTWKTVKDTIVYIKDSFIVIFTIIVYIFLPTQTKAQFDKPDWINTDYQALSYPADEWYTGYVMDNLGKNEQLLSALQRVENSARNQLIEQIRISVISSSKLETKSVMTTDGEYSKGIASTDYYQEIFTSSNATVVNTIVQSYYDTENRMVYAFACVKRNDLANYYLDQESSILKKIEDELVLVQELEKTGKKIAAYDKCVSLRDLLVKAQEYSLLASIVLKSQTNQDKTRELFQRIETYILKLKQSTKVYVSCIWECYEYPQYTNIANIVKDNICSILSQNNCVIVPNNDEADYVLNLSLSASLRSNGDDTYNIISYYPNISGEFINTTSNKPVSHVSIYQDSRFYSAGKNEYQAIIKSFQSKELINFLKNFIINGLNI